MVYSLLCSIFQLQALSAIPSRRSCRQVQLRTPRLSSLVQLPVPGTFSHCNKDESTNTAKTFDFGLTLRQLQSVTPAKAQLNRELHHEQEKLAEEQADQWARMQQHLNTTFREGLFHVSPAYWVRLLPWFLSTAANPCAVLTCSMGEAFTTAMQPELEAWVDETTPEFEGVHAPASVSIPTHQASTLPSPILPISDFPASDTLVGLATLIFTISPKPKKHKHSTDSAPNNQGGKRAHTKTKGKLTSAVSISFYQLATALNPLSPSSLISPPVQSKVNLDPNHGMVVRASGEHWRPWQRFC